MGMPSPFAAAAAGLNKTLLPPAATVRPTKLFIGGLTRHTTTKQLRDHFSQYGRILDCVAMRKPDGHPRGFGYVTLDSLAAAERCLAEPQVIDGRVVDMKRAVPGNAASNSSSPNSSHSPQDAAKRQNMQQEQQQPWRWQQQQQQQQQQHGAGAAGGLPGALLSPFSPLGAWDIAGAYLSAATGFPGSPYSPAAAWAASWAAAAAAATTSPSRNGPEMFDCLEPLKSGTSTGSSASAQDLPETPVNFFDTENTPLSSGRVGSMNLSRALGRRSAPALNLDDVVSPMSACGRTPMAGSSSMRTCMGGSSLSTPMAAPGHVLKGTADDETPQKVELFVKSARAGRSVLGDITNIVAGECNAGLSPLKAPLPTPSSLSVGRVRSPGLENHEATPQTASMRQPSFAVLDECLDSPDTASTSLSDISLRSQEYSFCNLGLEVSRIEEAFDEDEDGADPVVVTQGLPSIGSADHEAGTCKRCNFFAKGRCQNDRGCKFCHLPHDKRKVSQQEKRERRSAWLVEQQNKASAGEVSKMSHAEGYAEEQGIAMYSMPPSPPPVVTGAALPAPLMLPGTVAGAESFRIPPYPCSLPPGLSPPRHSPQAAELISNELVNHPAKRGQTFAEAPAVKQTATISTQTSPQKIESAQSSCGLGV